MMDYAVIETRAIVSSISIQPNENGGAKCYFPKRLVGVRQIAHCYLLYIVVILVVNTCANRSRRGLLDRVKEVDHT